MEINNSSITTLKLSKQYLTKLPDDILQYINLIKLDCQNNEITSLDNLPSGLQHLTCTYNKITSLDNLPLGLQYLDYSNNLLQYNFVPILKILKL